MLRINTCRWCGIACILCGVLLPISWILEVVLDYPPSLATMSLDFIAITLIIFALSGIFAFQGEQIGIAGFLGYLLTILMSCLGLSLISWSPASAPIAAADTLVMLMGISGLVGYTLLAFGSWKADLLPRWAVLLWRSGSRDSISSAGRLSLALTSAFRSSRSWAMTCSTSHLTRVQRLVS